MVADMSPSHGIIDGHVEKLGEIFGTEAWVLDQDDPSRVLTVELWAGDDIIAVTSSGNDRPDVARDRGIAARPGFCFDTSVRDEIARVAARGIDSNLSTCAREPDMLLRSFARLGSREAVRRDTAKSRVPTTDAFLEWLSEQADDMVAMAPRNDAVIEGAFRARQPERRGGTSAMLGKAVDMIYSLSFPRGDRVKLAEPIAEADPKVHCRLPGGIPAVLSSLQTAARYSSIVEGMSKADAATRLTIVAYPV